MARRLILLEINEVPFRVLDAYAQQFPASHLARLMAGSRQFHAVCEDQTELDPWISWASLHRGVADDRHGILHLGQPVAAANRRYPPIWELVARGGRQRVGVMGSLHSSEAPADLSGFDFYVPDCFAADAFAHPAGLQAFQRFNLMMTRNSPRNVKRGLPVKETLGFLRHYLAGAASLGTARQIAMELATETLRPHLKTRRRSIQPLIAFDYFEQLLRRSQPDFASFHTNNVAAAMHRYWEACYPQDMPDGEMPLPWRRKFGGEIDYAMGVVDACLGRLLALSKRYGYTLMLCGSLGQAPVKSRVAQGYFMLTDVAAFLGALGLRKGDWTQRPAMAPCVSVDVRTSNTADLLQARLECVRQGSTPMRRSDREIAPLSYARNGNSFHLYVNFSEYTGERVAHVGDRAYRFDELGWGWIRQEDEVECSARHTPFGALLVYPPGGHAVASERRTVTTLDIAPSILDFFGLPKPPHMNLANPGLFGTSAVREFYYEGGGIETPIMRPQPLEAAAG